MNGDLLKNIHYHSAITIYYRVLCSRFYMGLYRVFEMP